MKNTGTVALAPFVSAIEPFTQEPIPTPEVDPFAEVDQANIDLIAQQIEANSREEFSLISPRVLALGNLDIRPLAPDIGFAVLADHEGSPYAILYNHDMDCVRDPLEEQGWLGEVSRTPGPARGTIFDPGLAAIEITPLVPEARPDELIVQRFIDEYPLEINSEKINVPVLVAKGLSIDGFPYDCPTIVERGQGAVGDIAGNVGEFFQSGQVYDALNDAGEFVGRAVGEVIEGLESGFRQSRSN